MKLIKTEDAVGHVLCHDITQIVVGVTKDARFRKGHIVTEEDIPVLLSLGKENLYVWENDESMMHEDDAAEVLCALCLGENMGRSGAKEGKIEIKAEEDGLFKINRKALYCVNSFGQMMIATRSGNVPVKKGDKLAGTRIIPLVIEKEKMEKVREETLKLTDGEPLLSLLPFVPKKAGIINTGSEVYHGRIKDTFTPVVEGKLKAYGSYMTEHEVLDDDNEAVTSAILKMIDNGADLVIVTGGMSVDPDDKTPLAINNTGARVVSYGAPVLPGAMFMLAYYEKGDRTIPVMGLPGCVMYEGRTIFDIVLPRVLADDKVTAEEIAALGEGGLCLKCDICTFPDCSFGKGRF